MNNLVLNSNTNLTLSENDRFRNILLTGMPGTGVSYYLSDVIMQDIRNKQPSVIIDPHGYLSDRILGTIPEEFTSNIAYIDFGSTDYPIGLNIYQAENEYEKREVANTIINIMYNLYDPQRTGIIGPRFEHAVRNAVLTILFDENPTFVELMRCLTDSEYVDKILPKVTDPLVKAYWTVQIAQTSDFHKSEVLDYIVSKLSRFVEDRKIRNIVNQSDTALNIEKLMIENKTIIFDFSAFYNDTESTKIISSILFNKLINIFRSKSKTQPISFYVDEVQNWDAPALIDILMHGKKYNVVSTLATSRIAQTDLQLRYELLRSGTIISFRLTGADADIIKSELEDTNNKEGINLKMLKKYHAYAKTLENGDPLNSRELDLTKETISETTRDIDKLKQLNRETYGTASAKVDQEINNKMPPVK